MKLLRPKWGILPFILILSLFAFQLKAQVINTVVGNGNSGFSGDGGKATSATISPTGICFDKSGNMYIADQGNASIRKVDVNGNISTVAGNGKANFYYIGDGYKATSISLYLPRSVLVDALGNIYIAEVAYNRILKVTTDGIIHTIAGTGNYGYTGDGGLATKATLGNPTGMAIDKAGNLYLADFGNNVIRKINTSGIITTIAGNGHAGYFGDGGTASYSTLNQPTALTVDANGNLLIVDAGNNVIRKIDSKGVITTIAGNGREGFSGDGGAATSATLRPNALTLAVDGSIFIADGGNGVIRKIDSKGIIGTVAGNGTSGYSGDGGFATLAKTNGLMGLALDAKGYLNIVDAHNYRIRSFNTSILPIIIASFSPDFASQGDTIRIKGKNFTGVTSVTFGDTLATSYTIVDDSTIFAVVGNATSGNIILKSPMTAGQIQGFTYKLPSTLVTSFSPLIASSGQEVVVHGKYFTNAYYVYFGGVAASTFTVINDSTLKATVGNGASGSISIYSYTNGSGSLDGFTYLPPPNTNLKVTVSTNIICKNAPVTFTIYNTQSTAVYSVWDSNYNKITKPVQGNGGTLNFVGTIPHNGNYKIEVSNINSNYTYFFDSAIVFKLENTKSSFVTSKVNVLQNETFNIAATSRDAQTFE